MLGAKLRENFEANDLALGGVLLASRAIILLAGRATCRTNSARTSIVGGSSALRRALRRRITAKIAASSMDHLCSASSPIRLPATEPNSDAMHDADREER